jgi:hypothetical protein
LNQCQKLASGLSLIGDSVVYVTFFDGSAKLNLDRLITKQEKDILSSLGFKKIEEYESSLLEEYNHTTMMFDDWVDLK